MKRFSNIDDLHTYLEKLAKKTIKSYYTDWKNYDRPALMRATGNRETVYIILREYGSYLYTVDDLINHDFPAVVMDYYTDEKRNHYYKVDLYNLTIEKIPNKYPEDLKLRKAA